MINRMERVTREIKREIAIILQEDADNPMVKHVTISGVEVSRDLRTAKIFCDIPETEDRDMVMKGLRSAAGFIRGELSKRIELKFTPKLTFVEDRTEERKHSIDDIFDQIRQESGEDKTEESEEYDG